MTAVRRKKIPLALEPHSERALAPKVLVLTRVILTEYPCVCTEKNDVRLPQGGLCTTVRNNKSRREMQTVKNVRRMTGMTKKGHH